MIQGKKKLWLFRAIMCLIVIAGLEAIGYTAMWVSSRSFDIASNKNYFQIRAMLIGDEKPEHRPRYLSLPYLGYIPYPGYKKSGVVQNNEDGYRGERIPLQKTKKLRVLCLGGSTTYGFAVDSPGQAYPARLEELLNQAIRSDTFWSTQYHGAEVMNAGLEAGTSAEELQQYLFKYRYYKADAVIIHSGVNDAMLTSTASPDFQLDYTHFRRLNFYLPPLSTPGRWLLRSYFFSFISIRVFYDKFAYNGKNGRQCFERQEYQRFCQWSKLDINAVVKEKNYEFYPFYRNSKSLFNSIVSDSSLLFIFPNALNRTSEFVASNKEYMQATELNATLSQKLADDVGGIYIPFAYDSIPNPLYWVDDCHMNTNGEMAKARILSKAIMSNLAKRKMDNN